MPKIVVEVGTSFGVSTSILRQAQCDTDLPDALVITIDRRRESHIGSLIPDNLRGGVVQLFGEITSLTESGSIPSECDLYFHDSTHSWKHQTWEYRHFWQRLRPGGMLVSHDVTYSSAFADFVSACSRHGTDGLIDRTLSEHESWGVMSNIGFIQKKARSQ
jgi:predicted O-methyltransferase YrrM